MAWLIDALKLVKATLMAGGAAFIKTLIDPQSRDQQEQYHAMMGEIAGQARLIQQPW